MSTAQSSRPAQAIRLHHFALSGHSHRALLMLSLLNLPVEVVPVDFAGGEHKKPAFLALNPMGQVPVIEDGDVVVSDSTAILVYLARRYDPSRQWLPEGALAQAEVQRWLSAASGPLAFGPAHARVGHVFKCPIEPRAYTLAAALFGVMNTQLTRQRFLASSQAPTIADVAMYSYTAHAPEGGIDLAPYPAIQRWLAEIEALPGFVPMPRSPLPQQGAAA